MEVDLYSGERLSHQNSGIIGRGAKIVASGCMLSLKMAGGQLLG